ncbi:Uma2 family endonuclease [Candidatus Electrothrix sp.]|uniref:Uma2 family endonuclease n=1 Tax=Candidatus Electrothrix sp. TaxID=2170559 RepID=UPI004055CBF9
MNSPNLTSNRHYTVDDYASWNDGQRYELLHGDVHAMTPAPSWQHQVVSANLGFEIQACLRSIKKCHLVHAPIDVYLLNDTVVQPDIIVVCDPNKIEKKGCVGAPDLVVEILSPSTAKTDWKHKYVLYEEAGVREYWIVNPEDTLVHVFCLLDGTFSLDDTYSVEDTVSTGIFEDVVIDLKNVFEPCKD